MLPDSVLDGSPEEHYVKIIQAADAYQVRDNVFSYFKKLAAYELLIEEKGLEEEAKAFEYDHLEEVEMRVQDFVIESMSHIVASHER